MTPDFIQRLKASAYHLPKPDPSPSNADSLNSNFLQLGRRSGGRPQRTVYPRQLPVSCDTHTTLAGTEPTTFRLLVRHATSRATVVWWWVTTGAHPLGSGLFDPLGNSPDSDWSAVTSPQAFVQLGPFKRWGVLKSHFYSYWLYLSANQVFPTDETPHSAQCAHRTTSRRERRVTGRFTPSSVRPIGRIQRFLNVSCVFS